MKIQFVTLLGILFSCGTAALEITTSIGTIEGKFEHVGDGGVHKFLGIPYAEAPVQDLRFRPPVPKKTLTSTLQAVRTGPVCPQNEEQFKFFNFTDDPDSNFEMSEDCLYLNVYVPTGAGGELPENLAVMFYIHSGGWSWGSGTHYDGRWLTKHGNVILVTFNYRLGILGFLRTEDRKIINNGFKDQILAFKWVRENIRRFGGDPDLITVFGHSAGGVSTVYLHAVPELRGQIKRIAPLAGLPSVCWAIFVPLEQKNLTRHIVEASGCYDDDYLTCLRGKSITELVKISMATTISMNMLTAWMPSPDFQHIIGRSHYDSQFVRNGLEEVDLLSNMATSEGTAVAMYLGSLQGIALKDHIPFEEIKALSLLHIVYPNADQILKDSFGETTTSVPVSEAVDFVTEFSSWYPLYDVARTHAETAGPYGKGTYVFVYDYVPEDRRGIFPRPAWQEKSVHGDELPLAFGSLVSEVRGSPSQKDRQTAKAFMTYLTNFAKTGNPNKPEPVTAQWPTFSGQDPQHLYLDKERFETKRWTFMVKSPDYWDKMNGLPVPVSEVTRDEL